MNDIEAKRSQAELEGNRELVALYEEQARKLTELNALKEKNIKADAKASTDTTSSTSSTTTSLSSASGGISTGKTYRLDLTAGNKSLTTTTTTDPTSFLDELERAKGSSA